MAAIVTVFKKYSTWHMAATVPAAGAGTVAPLHINIDTDALHATDVQLLCFVKVHYAWVKGVHPKLVRRHSVAAVVYMTSSSRVSSALMRVKLAGMHFCLGSKDQQGYKK